MSTKRKPKPQIAHRPLTPAEQARLEGLINRIGDNTAPEEHALQERAHARCLPEWDAMRAALKVYTAKLSAEIAIERATVKQPTKKGVVA